LARLSHDLVVVGDGALARLTACLVAKTGKRVVRLRRQPGPAPSLPPFQPLDLTLLPTVREAALKLGILVPLRDRLRQQYSLGHYCSARGSAELFLERAARDHQQQRLNEERFERWCATLAETMGDPTPVDYPLFFHRGWWQRFKHRRGWTELALDGDATALDALNRPYFMHPWTSIDKGNAHLRWNGHRDLHVLDRPLHTFLELAEARSGVELVGRDHVTDYDVHRGRLVSLVTERGQHIGGETVIWSDPIADFNIGSARTIQKLQQRWEKDEAVTTPVRRLYGRLAAVDWPPFLGGPILVGDGELQINVEARGHEIHLEAWLTQDESEEGLHRFFERHFPMLGRQPLSQSESVAFIRRLNPQALPPRLDSGVGGVFMVPDRLIHGLGLDAPFAMAQQLAERIAQR
jgi:hypothetical protein